MSEEAVEAAGSEDRGGATVRVGGACNVCNVCNGATVRVGGAPRAAR